MKMMHKKSALRAVLALAASLLVVPAVSYAEGDPKAAAKAAKEAAAKAKEAAKQAAIEKAKEQAKEKAAEKAEKNAKVREAKADKAKEEAEAASKAEAEQNAKNMGVIERLEQIATATNNAELTTVVTRLKEKETKRHELAAPPAK